MRSDIDPDVFLSEVFQLLDELNDYLGETVTDERLTTIILDEGKQNDTNCLMSRMNGKKTHTHFTYKINYTRASFYCFIFVSENLPKLKDFTHNREKESGMH